MTFALRMAFALAVLTAVLGANPAWAGERDAVASSSPAAGAVVPLAPPVVTLRMAGPVDRASATVVDGCGQEVPSDVFVAGGRVSIRLAVSHAGGGHTAHTSAGGSWLVSWRAVGAGGRTTAGNVPFTVRTAVDCAPAAAPTAAAAAAPGPSDPDLPLLLYAFAGLGVLLTFARVATRKSRLFPQPQKTG